MWGSSWGNQVGRTVKQARRHPDRALTALQVKQAKQPGKLADGNGLYLVIDPSGAKRWLQRLVVQGRRRDLGLGSATLVTLAEAREKALVNRKVARDGGDPLALRVPTEKVPTFAEAAELVHGEHEIAWKNPKHAQQWLNTLRQYAFPTLGPMPVSQIATHDILKVLSPIWLSKAETARRVRQRIGTVLDWSKAAGHRSGDNPVEGVARGLPKQPTRDSHHSAMPFADVPAFVTKVRLSDGSASAKLAFEFLIQTATRTSEVLLATWLEIDEKETVWTIPAERMKAKRAHRVPLSPRLIELLKSAKEVESNGLVFPGSDSEKPLSNMVFLSTLKRMKLNVTAHGFRSSFSDWAAETTNFPREVVEMALAHTVSNKVEAAYRRGDLFEKRRELMSAWSDYIQGGAA